MSQRPLILMVDDNPGDHELTRIALAEAELPFAVETAQDGKEGQAALQRLSNGESGRYTLVLLDLNMPRMDGRQLLAWARQQESLRGLPIIVLTSSHAPKDQEECLAMGATEYWVKPADFDEYVQCIGNLARYLPALAPLDA